MFISFTPEKPQARIWGQTGACVELGGGTAVVLADAAECDDLIRAAVEAKQLLAPPAADPFADGPGCGADHPNHEGAEGYTCFAHRGGMHYAAVTGWPIRREPVSDAAAVPARMDGPVPA